MEGGRRGLVLSQWLGALEVRSWNTGDSKFFSKFQFSIAVEDFEVRIIAAIWTDVSNKSMHTGNPGLHSQEARLIQAFNI